MKNGFVVACEETREAVLIDPGDEVQSLLCRSVEKPPVRHILLTHAHVDHVTGVAAAKTALWRARVPAPRRSVPVRRTPSSGAMFGLHVEPQPPIDVFYTPGQVIAVRPLEVRPHHTPGHCPGGVCLQIGRSGETGKDLFVGDTLFAGSIGRTDLPGGDYATLIPRSARCSSRLGTTRCTRAMAPTRPSATNGGRIRFLSTRNSSVISAVRPSVPRGRSRKAIPVCEAALRPRSRTSPLVPLSGLRPPAALRSR